MRESQGSLAGVTYTAANGQIINNDGEKLLTVATRDTWQTRMMTFQCADVTKALGSVSKICSNGNRVIFDDDGSHIENKQSGEILWMKQVGGLYTLDVEIAPPSETHPFQGPGA